MCKDIFRRVFSGKSTQKDPLEAGGDTLVLCQTCNATQYVSDHNEVRREMGRSGYCLARATGRCHTGCTYPPSSQR